MTAHRQPICFISNETVRTAYRYVGEGPLLLLIHGAEADHSMFLDLIDALAGDFSVVAYDQRDSGRTENGSALYDLSDLANDAAKLINFLQKSPGPSRVHVYGTSFGGQVAQVLAARHAHLIDRLILGSTWSVDRKLSEVNTTVLEQLARLRRQLPGSAEQIASFFFSQSYLSAHPETVERFRVTQRSVEQAKRRALMMQVEPPVIEFASITAPTLLLAGGADRLIPSAETFDIARRIAHTHQQELPGLPHVGVIEDAEGVAHAIRRFLLASESM